MANYRSSGSYSGSSYSGSKYNKNKKKEEDYTVPGKLPSKYVEGVGTVKVQAPDTDGRVYVRISLKPEDIEEIYSLYVANGRGEFRLYCFAKEGSNQNPNEDPYWWGHIRYNTYKKDLAPKGVQELRDRFFKNTPGTKDKYYSPPPQPQNYRQAWQEAAVNVEGEGGNNTESVEEEEEEWDGSAFF